MKFLKDKKVFFDYLKIVFTVFFLTSIWWLSVIIRHGHSPFFSFASAGFVSSDFPVLGHFLFLQFTDESRLPLFGVLALLGVFKAFSEKKLWLPLWFFFPFLIAPRSAPNLAVAPISILIAISIVEILLPSINYDSSSSKNSLKKVFLSVIFIYTLSIFFGGYSRLFPSLSKSDRNVMVWVKENTANESRFLILNQLPFQLWARDAFSEWFPALTERTSIMTVQGYEWLPNLVFHRKLQVLKRIKKDCYSQDFTCIENIVQDFGLDFTHVLIFKSEKGSEDISLMVRKDLQSCSNYRMIYENDKIIIYVKV